MSKPPSTPPVSTAQLDWSEDGTPVSSQFDDVYFSRHSGIDETRYVFLEQNHLAERLAALVKAEEGTFHIGETGFGTGLNFLCTWQLRDTVAPNCHLQFTSVEKYPLTAGQLEKALSSWPQLARYAQLLIAQYPILIPGWHRISFLAEKVDLNLFIGDVLDGVGNQTGGVVDAWFLDGFAPAKNPEMWSVELFRQLVRLGKNGTTFSTFTAASAVREGLKEAGFTVTRVKGYGRKRHMLTGELLLKTATPEPDSTPWFRLAEYRPENRTAIVIGGGLAGTSSAFSLARRGWQVVLCERHGKPAQEGSGNNQGVLYTKLSADCSTKSDFYTHAFLYAAAQLRQLLHVERMQSWDACGVLQLAHHDKEAARQMQLLENNPQPEALIHAVTPQQASMLAGVELTQGGLFMPAAGWVKPGALCHRYLEHPGIDFRPNTPVEKLRYQQQQWQLLDHQGDIIAQAPTVIIANAYDALRFDISAFLPLKRIRGQVTHIPASATPGLKTVICGNAYVAPPINGHYHLGATFNLDIETPDLRIQDHQRNIEQISELVPALATRQGWQQLDTASLEGRVGFRCTSPDYMPLAGPVPDYAAFLTHYARLRKDATTPIDTAGHYFPGLYVNTGHGSKGLVSCPLASEIIASQICGEALPLDRRIVDTLNPARFIIRDLIRNKI